MNAYNFACTCSKLLIKPQNVKRTTDLPGDQLRELTTDLEVTFIMYSRVFELLCVII